MYSITASYVNDWIDTLQMTSKKIRHQNILVWVEITSYLRNISCDCTYFMYVTSLYYLMLIFGLTSEMN